jgi:hypothetical protein
MFWNNLECNVGQTNVVVQVPGAWCKKNGYRISDLYDIIGDRMVTLGRMGEHTLEPLALQAAEYMPDTVEEFLQSKATGKWKYDFVAKYMTSVDEELARKYYASSYDMKSVKKDVACIKEAMKSVKL